MKKILIISPHFPPSNLAGVHRSRLFAQHLPKFGWDPTILTVDERFYEEELDENLLKLIPSNLKVEKVNAFKVRRPRIIGDLGIRSFYQLYKKAKSIIREDKIDFLYIPIPSFYVALLGRLLHINTGIKYGIDYIDPWVHIFPGSEKIFSRHWWSTKLAKMLEPIAVKKASLITGVAEGYYKGVQERYPFLNKSCIFGAMPYGGEALDHEGIKNMNAKAYLFQNANKNKIKLFYAGAMLPKAYLPLEAIFQQVHLNPAVFEMIEMHFVGTGKSPNDPNGYNIKELAEKYELWGKVVFEFPKRIPYLDVLKHLDATDGVFILGSTEPHYTPSKIYQAVLAQKPILAVLHKDSSAVKVIQNSSAGIVLPFAGEDDIKSITDGFVTTLQRYLDFLKVFNLNDVNKEEFEQYSAKNVTASLAKLLESAHCEE